MRRVRGFAVGWAAYVVGALLCRAFVAGGPVDRAAVLQAAASGLLTLALFAAYLRRRARRDAAAPPLA